MSGDLFTFNAAVFSVVLTILRASYCSTSNLCLLVLVIPSSSVRQKYYGVAHSGPNIARAGPWGLQVLKAAEPGAEM